MRVIIYEPGWFGEDPMPKGWERWVTNAGAEHDAILFDYFVAQTEERVAEALSIQPRLAQYALPRVNL
jgi:hypothetical protein